MSSLSSSLGLAGSALQAAGTAVRTTGQNIANANTDGFTRQRVDLAASPADIFGQLRIGTGVDVTRVERLLAGHLEELLRDAGAKLGELSVKDDTLGRVETIVGELDGSDSIGTALSKFFDAAQDLANRPEDGSARTLFLSRAEDLASSFTT